MIALVIAVGAFALALWTPLRVALVVLISALLLVPSGLVPPHSPSSVLSVQRLVAAALIMNVLLRIRRGEVSGRVFEVTPVHAMFLAFLGVAFVLGVSLAQPNVTATTSSHIWANYLGEFVIFIAALATFRAIGDTTFAVSAIASVFLVSAGIGIIEHITGSSYERLLFRGTPEFRNVAALGHRGGEVRIRVASDFALSYAWVATALVPVFVVAAVARLRRWLPVAVGLSAVLIAIYWTHSRSVFAALVIGLLVLAIVGRSLRVVALNLTTIAVMAAAYFASASIVHNLSAGIAQGSIDVRLQRIAPITASVATHAFGGLGFGGVSNLGFQAVDSSYLLLYGDVGVIGLTMFALLYATAVVMVGRGVLATDPRQRLIAAAITVGVVTMIVAGFVYDTESQLFDQYVLWLLVALGIVVAERSMGQPRWLSRPTVPRLAAVASAFGVGLIVYFATPTHVGQTFVFSTLSRFQETVEDPPNTGTALINSVCGVTSVGSFSGHGVELSCQDTNAGLAPQALLAGQVRGGPGQGELHIQAPDARRAFTTVQAIERTVHAAPHLQQVAFHRVGAFSKGRPTVQRTAPVWLPMIAGVAVLLLPRRRRRQSTNLPSARR